MQAVHPLLGQMESSGESISHIKRKAKEYIGSDLCQEKMEIKNFGRGSTNPARIKKNLSKPGSCNLIAVLQLGTNNLPKRGPRHLGDWGYF